MTESSSTSAPTFARESAHGDIEWMRTAGHLQAYSFTVRYFRLLDRQKASGASKFDSAARKAFDVCLINPDLNLQPAAVAAAIETIEPIETVGAREATLIAIALAAAIAKLEPKP